jgi:hypothetical protein
MANVTFNNSSDFNFNIYNGMWENGTGTFALTPPQLSSAQMNISFVTSTLTPIALSAATFGGTLIIATQYNLSCVPWRATYTMLNTYENNIQHTTVSTTPVEPLQILQQNNWEIEVPGFYPPGQVNFNLSTIEVSVPGPASTPANWTNTSLSWWRDMNIMTLFRVSIGSLAGAYTTRYLVLLSSNETAITIPGFGDRLWVTNLGWDDDTESFTSNGTVFTQG